MIAVRKLPARYAPVVMPLVLSVMMTFVVSMISTLRSLGPISQMSKVPAMVVVAVVGTRVREHLNPLS